MPLILFFLLLAVTASGQLNGRDPKTLALSGPYHRRVIVPDHMTLVLSTPEIQIDTLIMDKKSVLKLDQHSTRLTIGYAVIGKNCMIDGRGDPGGGIGSRGNDGKSLSLTINFQKLGRLVINTSGGQGTNGRPGRPGIAGQSGSTSMADGGPGGPGGRGGSGGNGGNLTVRYRCMGFVPILGKAKRNSLILRNQGGSGGGGGPGGSGGPGGLPTRRSYIGPDGRTVNEVNGVTGARGPSGTTGNAGDKGKDGVLVVEDIDKLPGGN